MSKYKNIIWDMDGTLLNTLDDLTDSVNAALAEFHLPAKSKSEIRSYIGNGILRLVELSVPNGRQEPQFQRIFTFFKNHYSKNCYHKTKPYDGLQNILAQLKAQGYRMAIVSNKADSEVKRLAQLYFKDAIRIATGEAAEIRKKPAPDMVLEAMRLLDANRETTVYIGDSEVDLATAQNTDIDCLSVSWGFRDKQDLQAAGAKLIFNTPTELAKYLGCG